MPILCMRSTSPRLEVSMCASDCVAISLLLISKDLLVVAFCRGGVTIKSDLRFSCTSSVNRARRRAASRGVGVVLLGSGVAWLSGLPPASA